MQKILLLFVLIISSLSIFAQNGTITGKVIADNEPVPFANVYIESTNSGTFTDTAGYFEIHSVDYGEYELMASMLGYNRENQMVVINADQPKATIEFVLNESFNYLNEVVVTGTKTFKRQTESPVIVNILSAQTLNNVQACNLSEGLNFQPGLRVETDCQTCNYTQLRMNGLAGGYSQILINGRPIFSPLTGLYGMEQLPVNMIDRIEVVRGGGSSLYGSSAVGGTVNVITRIPKTNSYELNYYYQSINGKASDHNVQANATVVGKSEKAGMSFFLNNRNRDFYDHNDDQFSEIPLIRNTSIGTNMFIKFTENQKLELSLSKLNEYRFGGDMTDLPAYLTQQSEERTHDVWLGSADYQWNFNNDNSSLIAFTAWQNTLRDHYTGIIPDDDQGLIDHITFPPYGNSRTQTYQGGLQLNHRINNFLNGSNVFTLGTEYIVDDVFDEIQAYQYVVDQTTKNLGIFAQSDWELSTKLNILAGIRTDKHNLVDKLVFSPRVSLLYKPWYTTQIRLSYGTGFRAPQAFDTDLHIAFAGGGVSRIQLSPDLKPEKSASYSASLNFDKAAEEFIAGFTIEGFYTSLGNAFYLKPIGEDQFGEVFEKNNGSSALVKGLTLELRGNYDQNIQVETGLTYQKSLYGEAISHFEGAEPIKSFLRTPESYGFATLTLFPGKNFNASVNYIYTGPMQIVHFAGAENHSTDEFLNTKPFSDLSIKASYTLWLRELNSGIEFYAGIKNVLNDYQDDFDIGKYRDSNYIYGPGLPRTFYLGLKWKSK